MKTILLFGTTLAVVVGILKLSRRTRETDTQPLQVKLQQLQDRFRSLDQIS
jgi:hypothetical protein